jgi:predicted sulfurtransferase
MRFILSLLTIMILGVFLACQTASSSTIEPKTERTAVKDDTKTDTRELAEQSTEPLPVDQSEGHDDTVKRISIADAKAAFDSGEAVFIDSRSKNAYETEHIKGAINIMVKDMEAQYKNLPKDKKIIVYCS